MGTEDGGGRRRWKLELTAHREEHEEERGYGRGHRIFDASFVACALSSRGRPARIRDFENIFEDPPSRLLAPLYLQDASKAHPIPIQGPQSPVFEDARSVKRVEVQQSARQNSPENARCRHFV